MYSGDMNYTDIADYEIPQEPKIAKRIQIKIAGMVFNESATFQVSYFLNDYDKNVQKIEYINVEGDEYAAWNNDDDYIINLVLDKLGLSKKDEPAPEPIPEPV